MANEEDYENYDYLYKLLLIGDSGVGKSCILVRFVDDEFVEDNQCTIGVDFKIKMMDFNSKRINLTIWDTAGQEKFRSLTSSYYRGTNGIILVYDVTRRISFKNLDMWLSEIEMYTNYSNPVKLLVGNKIDKSGDREVPREEAAEFARNKGMVFIETSAKTKAGIQQAFEEIVQKIMDRQEANIEQRQDTVSVNSNAGSDSTPQEGCGC